MFLARDLTQVDRPEAEHEEADLTLDWVDLAEAVAMVFRGEIVNSIAIAGIMTANEVAAGRARPREVDAPFTVRPEALPARRISAGVVPDMKNNHP